MQVRNVLHVARWKYRTQKWRKNRHLGTIAQICWAISLQQSHVSTLGEKLVKQQYLLHMFSQCGELQPTSGWDWSVVWSIPTHFKFNGFLVLAPLLHGTLAVGVSQTLRRWTEGATYIRQDGHHVGHWPTFYFFLFPRLISQPSQIGCLPYFHTWCGLSANLRCRSETCFTRLAENTGCKKGQKFGI